MSERDRIAVEFAAIMLGGEVSHEPPGLDTPLGRWLASGLRDSQSIRRMWAESGWCVEDGELVEGPPLIDLGTSAGS